MNARAGGVLTATLGLAAASWVVAVRQMNGMMDMGVADDGGDDAAWRGSGRLETRSRRQSCARRAALRRVVPCRLDAGWRRRVCVVPAARIVRRRRRCDRGTVPQVHDVAQIAADLMTNSKTDAGAALRPGIAGWLAPLGALAVAFLAVAQAARFRRLRTALARNRVVGSRAAPDQRRRRRRLHCVDRRQRRRPRHGNCLVVLPVARALSSDRVYRRRAGYDRATRVSTRNDPFGCDRRYDSSRAHRARGAI
jgi:hypothetical protein